MEHKVCARESVDDDVLISQHPAICKKGEMGTCFITVAVISYEGRTATVSIWLSLSTQRESKSKMSIPQPSLPYLLRLWFLAAFFKLSKCDLCMLFHDYLFIPTGKSIFKRIHMYNRRKKHDWSFENDNRYVKKCQKCPKKSLFYHWTRILCTGTVFLYHVI